MLSIGLGLVAVAYISDNPDEGGIGPSVLLEFGASIALVGAIFILEPLLVRHVARVAERPREDVSVQVYVRKRGAGTDDWDNWTIARPGDELEYMIRFKNEGTHTLRTVMVGNNLPKYHNYLPGTTGLRNGAFPAGVEIESDNITRGGIDVGHYDSGAVGYVRFAATLDPINAFAKLGDYDVRNVGVVRPAGMNEHFNVAKVLIVAGDGASSLRRENEGSA